MQLSEYINEKNVFFMNKKYKLEVLHALIEKAVEQGYVHDAAGFKAAIEAREGILSTGIGQGIAIPHAKLSSINTFFVMTAILNPPIGWDALDQQPVGLVFLIGGPENTQTAYLQLLAKLMGIVKNVEKRTSVLAATSIQSVLRTLVG